MDAREKDRLDIARRVSSLLRLPDFRDWLGFSEGQERALVVALPDDRLRDVLPQVDRCPPRMNLITLSPAGRLTSLFFDEADAATFGTHEDDCSIHADVEVGMIVNYLKAVGRPIRFHAFKPVDPVEPGYTVELLSDDDVNGVLIG